MSEEKPCLLDVQKKVRPKIEDIIPQYLEGDMKKSTLDFISYMRANKMSPGWAGFTNAWKAVCKRRCICYIQLGKGKGAASVKNASLVVTPFLEHITQYEETIISEGLQHFLWDNVLYCANKPKDSFPPEEFRNYALNPPCNIWNCAPGKTITVCGREMENICRNGNRQHFWFHNPDETALEAIKRFLELEQKARIGTTK